MKIRLGFAQNWLASAILLCITLFRLFPGSSAVEQATVNRLAGGSNPSRGASLLSLACLLGPTSVEQTT